MLIPVHNLLIKPNMPAGMDWSVIGHFAMHMRKSAAPIDPAIDVERLDCGHYLIHEGRHRYFGSVIAGRTHIDATEET